MACEHGHSGYCGFCTAAAAPKCKHGIAFFCGFCAEEARVRAAAERDRALGPQRSSATIDEPDPWD